MGRCTRRSVNIRYQFWLGLTCCYTSELESALTSFREILRQSWTRRALRTLTVSQPAFLLHKLKLTDITSLRDHEWEARERSYHDRAIEDINALVRKYNGLAPYSVRRPYYVRMVELEKAYEDAGPAILRGMEERASKRGSDVQGNIDDSEKSMVQGVDVGPPLRIRDVIRQWLSKLTWRRS